MIDGYERRGRFALMIKELGLNGHRQWVKSGGNELGKNVVTSN